MADRELENGWTARDNGAQVDFLDEDGDVIFYVAASSAAHLSQCNDLVNIWRQGYRKGQTDGIGTAQRAIRHALGIVQ